MDSSTTTSAARLRGMGKAEFIAMMAMLMAINALAIDIMLPGLQQIGASLGVASENHRQYVISAYLMGFAVSQLFYGPISDRFGRRVPMFVGLVVYIGSALACVFVPTFTSLLLFRLLQGIGSAATRVITISIVRDVYGGRSMAEVMSLIMMVFMIVPVIAPGTGQTVMLFGNWHLIFIFMAAIASAVLVWVYLRLPETLDPADVRPFTLKSVLQGFRIVLTNRVALCYTLANSFIFGALFGFINSAQQIYVGIYDLGVWFPVAFSAVAVTMAVSSFLNSRLVGRFGMRRLSHGALLSFLAVNGFWLLLTILGPNPTPFPIYLLLFALAMFQFGWIGSNFNALAMEPLGHVAGTASSVLGFMSTAGGGVVGAVIGQAFNGTTLPLVAGFFVLSLIGLVFVLIAERGRLFQPHNRPV
ncbi:MFS transporter, DHA1 family, bicyclomycin/chloramphenicol resistance protein [Phyllobacterium sp. YR620]|nr:MFS transporter, DHA1 family, bicyclomycin/chloramphenicol resistance protein [Phyllobacterium sp. YR620]SFI50775.1 MFS transporter, DHA1 family, bicyclomycin/chloramphenicol resistance protein [Phyllobacterium sp. CL33Tsu]